MTIMVLIWPIKSSNSSEKTMSITQHRWYYWLQICPIPITLKSNDLY